MSQQGTTNFMSIEVAAQKFLFKTSDPISSGLNFEQLLSAVESDEGMTQTKIPFFHNHLHDLESLWWVAVWVVFYNNFSEPNPSFTFRDAEYQFHLARTVPAHVRQFHSPQWLPTSLRVTRDMQQVSTRQGHL